MELNLLDSNKQNVSLNDAIFTCEYKEGLIHQVVTAYLANARQATSRQKTRSEVSGGGKKPWRQKGTGRARAGTIRSPLWRSGGVTFASRRPNYKQKVNKKMYAAAMKSILAELNRLGRLKVIEALELEQAKTKVLNEKLKSWSLTDVLIISHDIDEKLYLAARNLVNVDVCDVAGVNPVSLLKHDTVLLTKQALAELEERFA